MHRTTIMIPEMLKGKLEKAAEREKISFGELVRRALQKYILVPSNRVTADSFLGSTTVFYDEGEIDVARRHDDYLYGEKAAKKGPR